MTEEEKKQQLVEIQRAAEEAARRQQISEGVANEDDRQIRTKVFKVDPWGDPPKEKK